MHCDYIDREYRHKDAWADGASRLDAYLRTVLWGWRSPTNVARSSLGFRMLRLRSMIRPVLVSALKLFEFGPTD